MGRPPDRGQTADRRVELRMTEAELAEIDAAAVRAGQTRSAFLLRAALMMARG